MSLRDVFQQEKSRKEKEEENLLLFHISAHVKKNWLLQPKTFSILENKFAINKQTNKKV